MRIINLLPHLQHYSYAGTGKGGRTLGAGESSHELDLVTLHHPQFRKDHIAGKVQLRLSPEDVAFLEEVLEFSRKPVKKVKKAEKPKKPKPKPAPKSNKAPAPPKRKLPPGQPDFGQPAVIDEKKAGEVDLAALRDHNRLREARKNADVDEIQVFLGSRV
jgi:hypothetical protein